MSWFEVRRVGGVWLQAEDAAQQTAQALLWQPAGNAGSICQLWTYELQLFYSSTTAAVTHPPARCSPPSRWTAHPQRLTISSMLMPSCS